MAVAIMATVVVPGIMGPKTQIRAKAYDASALSAGRNAKLAQELYFDRRLSETGRGAYATKLDQLLAIDPHLADDQFVTFTFGPANSSGYTFTTGHKKTENRHTFEDQMTRGTPPTRPELESGRLIPHEKRP